MARSPQRDSARTRRVPVRLPECTPSGGWLRSIRLSGFAITALGLIVLALVVLAPSLRVYIQQQQQIAALQEGVAQAKTSVSDLKSQKARWDDPKYIEALARKRLNYVFPGEYSYLVINDAATPTTKDGEPISDSIQSTRVDWVGTMLSSIFTAGLTDAPADKLVAPVIKQGAQ